MLELLGQLGLNHRHILQYWLCWFSGAFDARLINVVWQMLPVTTSSSDEILFSTSKNISLWKLFTIEHDVLREKFNECTPSSHKCHFKYSLVENQLMNSCVKTHRGVCLNESALLPSDVVLLSLLAHIKISWRGLKCFDVAVLLQTFRCRRLSADMFWQRDVLAARQFGVKTTRRIRVKLCYFRTMC